MTQGAFQLDWHITHWVWLTLIDIKLRFDNFNMNSYRLELWLVFHAKDSVGQAMVSFFPQNHCWERKLFWPVALQVQTPMASFYYRNDCRSCWLVSVACKDHWRQGRKVTDHRGSNPKSTKWIKRLECSSQRSVKTQHLTQWKKILARDETDQATNEQMFSIRKYVTQSHGLNFCLLSLPMFSH